MTLTITDNPRRLLLDGKDITSQVNELRIRVAGSGYGVLTLDLTNVEGTVDIRHASDEAVRMLGVL